jgi:cytochrome c
MSRCSDARLARGAVAALAVLVLVAPAAGAGTATVASSSNPSRPALGFGKPATPAEIAGWDIDVRPDGTGLPRGRGTVAQGQDVYDAKCASCHGTFGESNDYLPLAGGVGTLASSQPMRTTGSKLNYATTLFDYIRRAMPFGNPQTLAPDEVYALTAYVLHLNDIVPADAALDQETLPKLKLPNRDGLTTKHGFMRRDGKPDTRNVACMKDCATQVRLSSEMPDYARDSHGNLAEQTRALGAVEGVTTVSADAAPSASKVAAMTPPAGASLVQKLGCMACHGVAKAIVGPAFRDIGAKYAPSAASETLLVGKIRNGGGGAWGAIPMPAQTQVKEGDAKTIVQWVLTGAK